MAHHHEKFNPVHLERLNNPERLRDTEPAVIWEALGSPSPAVVVDLGAGTGLFAEAFAKLAPEATVYAVDTERGMIDWMTNNRKPAVGERFVPVLSEEESVPLPSGSADVVVSMNLHHELANPVATYAEAARLLVPGGIIAVVDWTPGVEGNGPPQEIRVSANVIATALGAAGLVDAQVHPDFSRHTLVSARKPAAS